VKRKRYENVVFVNATTSLPFSTLNLAQPMWIPNKCFQKKLCLIKKYNTKDKLPYIIVDKVLSELTLASYRELSHTCFYILL